jgi:hypothetical protein
MDQYVASQFKQLVLHAAPLLLLNLNTDCAQGGFVTGDPRASYASPAPDVTGDMRRAVGVTIATGMIAATHHRLLGQPLGLVVFVSPFLLFGACSEQARRVK